MVREPERRTLEGQIEYYRRRAQTGSDPWITRAVREEATYAPDDALGPEESEALRALEELDLRGNILELACGTGAWTEHLVPHASRVTAVDASPEILEVNRARVGDPSVEYVVADVFEWEPPCRYDAVVFAFWLSHVPATHFERFWNLVSRCLRPEGRVFFVDEARHNLWEEEWLAEDVVRRRLPDGSEHRVVKVLWAPDDLERELRRLGWQIRVTSAGSLYWGEGTLR